MVIPIGEAKSIDDAVARWKEEASRGMLHRGRSREESEAAYSNAGATLRRLIWDPLSPALRDADRVFVIPDGSLNLVNLAALPSEDGGYLIENGPLVHYLSTERDLAPGKGELEGVVLLAVGRPDYDAKALFASLQTKKRTPDVPSKDGSSAEAGTIMIASAGTYRGQHSERESFSLLKFKPLPATGKETGEIVDLWRKHAPNDSPGQTKAVELRDVAASETELKRLACGHRVLHLATHGFFLGSGDNPAPAAGRGIGGLQETPIASSNATSATSLPASSASATPGTTEESPLLLSGLVLAGANHRSAAGEGEDDGILTAEEIASLDLSGVEWAVLSACETGVGDIRAGEGVFGLRRAFRVAGASTLIMSLWSVDDEATRSWMKSLYEARLIDRAGTAEAARHASLQVLHDRRARRQSAHPFYWAAFVAAGDWR
jgi:CHAT domain-containing protein